MRAHKIVRLPKVVVLVVVGSLGTSCSNGVCSWPGGEVFMRAGTEYDEFVLIAPERIVADTRSDFRSAALQHLADLTSQHTSLVIDMSRTVELDASGLGILVLIQKRAKDRGMSTCLRHAPERVRNLLKLTKLDFLFELT